MADIVAGIFLCVITMTVFLGTISVLIYILPDLIDKLRDIKNSWDYLKEEWSDNDK